MSNCANSANSQLKALHARLDRVDQDLMAHYAGISQLVAGLAANPLTAPSVALSLPTFNFSAAGHTLVKKLVSLIPGVDTFKALQHIDAAAMVEGMAASLATQAANVALNMAQQEIDAAAATATAVLKQAEAAKALAVAIAQNLDEVALIPLRLAVTEANGILSQAQAAENTVKQVLGAVTKFMTTMSDIGNCKTHSATIVKS